MLAGRFGSTVNFDLLYSKNQSKLVHLKLSIHTKQKSIKSNDNINPLLQKGIILEHMPHPRHARHETLVCGPTTPHADVNNHLNRMMDILFKKIKLLFKLLINKYFVHFE